MRFWGGKWEKKNEGEGNGNRMSCFALGASFRPSVRSDSISKKRRDCMGWEVDLSTALLTMRL
jgi:hypothetical protein